MRVFYWHTGGEANNFGDELNPWLWPRELGPLLDGTGPWLVGIGSLLGSTMPLPASGPRLVVGAGAGYGQPPSLDPSWRIYAVRGPLTAALLGLPPEAAACDPAVLVRQHFPFAAAERRSRVGLMLHWRTVNAAWRELAADLGWTLVDPLETPERVMDAIAGVELLVTEALHGAIVADAFRVPWIPIRTSREILPFKWEDWCASIGLRWKPVVVPQIYPDRPDTGPIAGTYRAAKRALVAAALRRVAGRRPVLSSDADLARAEARIAGAIDRLRADAALGEYRGLPRG